MLTWDEEVKPISPASNNGSLPSRVIPSPIPQVSALPHPAAGLATHAPIVVRAAKPASALRLNAADKRIINGQTDGVLGLNASMFKRYLRYIANRRATQIGLETLFPNEENPFPWMSEMIDLKKERNFFETRVIEYQTGGALSWD